MEGVYVVPSDDSILKAVKQTKKGETTYEISYIKSHTKQNIRFSMKPELLQKLIKNKIFILKF